MLHQRVPVGTRGAKLANKHSAETGLGTTRGAGVVGWRRRLGILDILFDVGAPDHGNEADATVSSTSHNFYSVLLAQNWSRIKLGCWLRVIDKGHALVRRQGRPA